MGYNRGKTKERGKNTVRIMGIDYGDARTGVAISDLLCSLVGSTRVIHGRNREKLLAEIAKIAKENEVGEIVVGLPRNMDGTYGEQAEKVKKFAQRLIDRWDGDYAFYDERLTTMAAQRVLIDADISREKRKQVIDKMAAVVILQGYMESHRNQL